MSAATIVNILQGTSLSYLWSIVNTIQMFEFVALVQVEVPSFVTKMINTFAISSLDVFPLEDAI